MQSIIKVSSKRQITIPADVYRMLGLRPGSKLAVRVEDGKIILSNVAASYTEMMAGSLKGVYGHTQEEVDEYVRRERESWE